MFRNSKKAIGRLEIVDLIAATKFSQDELEEMYEEFIIENPSGDFDLVRFKDQFRAANLPLKNVDLFATEIFRVFDMNRDNKIDFREHLIARSVISRGNAQEKLRWLFCIFDRDENGLLSALEVLGAAKVVCNMAISIGSFPEDPDAEEWTDKFFRRLNKDRQGDISLDDFVLVAKNDPLITMLLSFSSKLYV